MKRILAILLCFAMLLSLFSCAKEEVFTETLDEQYSTEEKKKPIVDPWKNTGEKVQNNYTVEDKSVKEKLAAIPIANSSMTTDELRQICVDFFRLSCQFPWSPSETFSHTSLAVTREPGTIYGGIPYISTGSGNLYRMMEYYDSETGILDTSDIVKNPKLFTNACSGGAFWAWFRVVNSFNSSEGAWTQNCTHDNGALRVGPYTYRPVQNFHEVRAESMNKYTAQDAVLQNTKETMFQSYAAALPGDGVVHPGHVRMVSSVPHVEYNDDGTINGEESYLRCIEQVHYTNSANHDRVQSDGTPYKAQGAVDKRYTFNNLYSKYYIPFTFAEFLGTDPVEKGEVTLEGVSGDSATVRDLSLATMKSNYPWSDVFFTIADADGNVVFSRTQRSDCHYSYSVYFGKWLLVSTVGNMIKPYAQKGGHTVTVEVQISTGEKLTAYTGLLTE